MNIKTVLTLLLMIEVLVPTTIVVYLVGYSVTPIDRKGKNTQVIFIVSENTTHISCHVTGTEHLPYYDQIKYFVHSWLVPLPYNVTFQVGNDDAMPVWIQLYFYRKVCDFPCNWSMTIKDLDKNSSYFSVSSTSSESGLFEVLDGMPQTKFNFDVGNVTLVFQNEYSASIKGNTYFIITSGG